uniref:GRAM domain-containing protein n=1 Tax=Photinus pyralis TaxID=7054 RepID=A0A1Y1MS77_PHOPY
MEHPQTFLIPGPSATTNPNSSANWAMLRQRGIRRFEDEKILVQTASTSCDLSVPEENKAQYDPFQRKSDKGTLFLTKERIVYLPSEPTGEPEFKSFSAPILNFQNPSATASFQWLRGGWKSDWKADCIPVSGGIIPPELRRIEVEFTFSDSSMLNTFCKEYDRVRQGWLRLQEEAIRQDTTRDERLPPYEVPGANPPESTTALTVPRTNRSDSSSSCRVPDEPPPGYDEAQAQ